MTVKRLGSLLLVAATAATVAVSASPASAAMCWEWTYEEHVIYDGPLTKPVTVDVPTRIDTSKCIVLD